MIASIGASPVVVMKSSVSLPNPISSVSAAAAAWLFRYPDSFSLYTMLSITWLSWDSTGLGDGWCTLLAMLVLLLLARIRMALVALAWSRAVLRCTMMMISSISTMKKQTPATIATMTTGLRESSDELAAAAVAAVAAVEVAMAMLVVLRVVRGRVVCVVVVVVVLVVVVMVVLVDVVVQGAMHSSRAHRRCRVPRLNLMHSWQLAVKSIAS